MTLLQTLNTQIKQLQEEVHDLKGGKLGKGKTEDQKKRKRSERSGGKANVMLRVNFFDGPVEGTINEFYCLLQGCQDKVHISRSSHYFTHFRDNHPSELKWLILNDPDYIGRNVESRNICQKIHNDPDIKAKKANKRKEPPKKKKAPARKPKEKQGEKEEDKKTEKKGERKKQKATQENLTQGRKKEDREDEALSLAEKLAHLMASGNVSGEAIQDLLMSETKTNEVSSPPTQRSRSRRSRRGSSSGGISFSSSISSSIGSSAGSGPAGVGLGKYFSSEPMEDDTTTDDKDKDEVEDKEEDEEDDEDKDEAEWMCLNPKGNISKKINTVKLAMGEEYKSAAKKGNVGTSDGITFVQTTSKEILTSPFVMKKITDVKEAFYTEEEQAANKFHLGNFYIVM
jgi:hypothetical protein